MKLIIAGSRDLLEWITKDEAFRLINTVLDDEQIPIKSIERIISGHARGADVVGEEWGEAQDPPIRADLYLPNWYPWPNEPRKFDKAAAFRRNAEMAMNGDGLLLLWNGWTNGSRNMLENALARKLYIMNVLLSQHPSRYEGYTAELVSPDFLGYRL
jgi:hypothetical protein